MFGNVAIFALYRTYLCAHTHTYKGRESNRHAVGAEPAKMRAPSRIDVAVAVITRRAPVAKIKLNENISFSFAYA